MRGGHFTYLIVDVLNFLLVVFTPLSIDGGLHTLFAVAIIPLAQLHCRNGNQKKARLKEETLTSILLWVPCFVEE
jgi:hypothetical protein